MAGPSKKDIQQDHHAVNCDADPSHAIEDHQKGVCPKKDSTNKFSNQILSFFFLIFFYFKVQVYFVACFFAGTKEHTLNWVQRRGRKEIAARGKRPLDINSNPSTSTDADGNAEKDTSVEQPPKAKRQKTGSNEVIHSCFTFDQHLPKFCCQVA